MNGITNNICDFEGFINNLSSIKKHELSIICNDKEALIHGYNNRHLVELLDENGFVINKKPYSVEITSKGKVFFEYFKKIPQLRKVFFQRINLS
jgi:hypothetical protein